MMKAKKPGVLFEHLAKAVRSEGPVIHLSFSSEDLSSSSFCPQLMPIFGTLAKRLKRKLQLKLKRRRLKTKRTIKQLETRFGLTDSMLLQDRTVQLKTS